MPGYYENKIKKLKNLVLIEKKRKRVDGIELIGHGGYVDVTDFIKHPIDKDRGKQKLRLARYRKSENKLKKIFSKNKPKQGFIFLIHYTPYHCLDKVKMKSSPMHGKHVGFEPYNNIIKRYKPALVICGHMHENQGKCRIGNSIIVNPGAASEGKAALIEFDEKKKKVLDVRFIR